MKDLRNERAAASAALGVEEKLFGGARVEQVAAVSRPVGTFEKYMSGMMTSPVVGAIGGNILKQFRVEIDYANGVVYLQKSGVAEAHDTDTVGLTLQADAEGGVTIAAVSPAATPGVIAALRAGDRLRQIDAATPTG